MEFILIRKKVGNMKKHLRIIIFIGIVLITVGYIYYVRPIVDDELFNYGFAKNILDGLIPYKDFNMIIPPLFHYLLALILAIFGKKLIIYHIVIAIFITGITFISYKKIGKCAIIVYILLLIYPYTGYNMFCLFLLFILLQQKDSKYSTIIEAIIISCMFLSKQTLGLLVIPSIIYSENKKKTILIYLTSICLFLLYLIINNSIYEFFDYCLFGMFDFANKNNTGISFLFIVECILIIILAIFAIKTKRKDLWYVLVFQIITLPIVDYYHFMISFIPIVYLYLSIFNKNIAIFILGTTAVLSFFISFNCMVSFTDRHFLHNYDVDNFMKGRVTFRITSSYVFQVKEKLEEYKDYRPYILGNFSYLIKLNNNFSINKYDIINNGNMGYNGQEKYLNEIDTYCEKEKCIFIMMDEEIVTKKKTQTNREILKYVQKKYKKRYSSNVFSVYTN